MLNRVSTAAWLIGTFTHSRTENGGRRSLKYDDFLTSWEACSPSPCVLGEYLHLALGMLSGSSQATEWRPSKKRALWGNAELSLIFSAWLRPPDPVFSISISPRATYSSEYPIFRLGIKGGTPAVQQTTNRSPDYNEERITIVLKTPEKRCTKAD